MPERLLFMEKNKHTGTQEKVDCIIDFYFNGQSGPSLDRKIGEWLVDGQNEQEKEEALKRQWDRQVGETRPDKETYAALAEVRSRLGFDERPIRVRRVSFTKVFLRAAAVLVLLLAVGGVWFFAAQNDGGNPAANQTTAWADQAKTVTVRAEQAGRVHVLLPDGSEVWVHRQGSITYPEDFVANRTVTLEGEAYFSVAKQDGQPFIVKGESISVRVLGTEFLVRSGRCEPRSQVEVTSGAVEVTVNEDTYVIGPSDRLVYEKRLEELLLTRVEPEEIAPVQVYPEQEPLVAKDMNIYNLRSGSYGSLDGSYLGRYTPYLKTASMYGTGSSYVKTQTPLSITSRDNNQSLDSDPISNEYCYVHVGGGPSTISGTYYSAARHKAAIDWWENPDNDGVIVYAVDPDYNTIFSNSPTKTPSVLSERGYMYKVSSATPKINTNSAVQGTRVMKYLLKFGPFRKYVGNVLQNLDYITFNFYRDGASTAVDPNSTPFSDGAVPVIVDENNSPMLVVDPRGKLVYWGESQMLDTDTSGYDSPPIGVSSNDKSKFLANLVAYIVNAAQYGSHFTDLFDESIISDTECSFLNE